MKSQEVEKIKGEKKTLVLDKIQAEQQYEDIKRDIELKDVKITSLQNIIQKRGFDSDKTPQVKQMEQQKQNLLQDNIKLMNQNEQLKDLKTQLDL